MLKNINKGRRDSFISGNLLELLHVFIEDNLAGRRDWGLEVVLKLLKDNAFHKTKKSRPSLLKNAITFVGTIKASQSYLRYVI